jgi:hypothetical protein
MLNGTHIQRANLPSKPSLVAELTEQLAELTRDQLAELAGQCEQLKALCWARIMSMSIPAVPPGSKSELAQTLTIAEIAKLLNKKPQYLYRNKSRFPFIKKIGPRSYACDPDEAERWFKTRKV